MANTTIQTKEKIDICAPEFTGKTVTVNLENFIPGGISVDGTKIRKCRLPYKLRQSSNKTTANPMIASMDRLIKYIYSGDPMAIRKGVLQFYNTRNRLMNYELDKVVRVRTAHSAMLVGIAAYRDDIFSAEGFNNNLSLLNFNEIGLNARVLKKLNLVDGDLAIISRYPTTRVLVVMVKMLENASDDVVYLPVGKIVSKSGTSTSISDLLDGDLDGDSYVIRTVQTAKDELAIRFKEFWKDFKPVPLDKEVLTYLEHQEESGIEQDYQKILQKTAIGTITKDWYAAFQLVADRKPADLDYEDIRQLMTDALETTFDLKHNNGADPMLLHSVLLGMTDFATAKEKLASQGVESLEKLIALTHGISVKELAANNPAYDVYSNDTGVQKFLNGTPPYKPLEFIAALICHRRLNTSLSADMVFAANTTTLAEHFRNTLFKEDK